jgi:hypothetical protein
VGPVETQVERERNAQRQRQSTSRSILEQLIAKTVLELYADHVEIAD